MLVTQRRETILAGVERMGAVRISDLMSQLKVSDMTVRRDLAYLESQGWLHRVHGGALLRPTNARSPRIEEISTRMTANWAIAARAAQLIQPDSIIALSAGVTTWMLARRMKAGPKVGAVVTNSTAVAGAMTAGGHYSDPDVILTGGVQMPSTGLVGPIAERSIKSLHVDVLFLGMEHMNTASGFSAGNHLEARADQALVASARQKIVLAGSAAWGTSGPAVVGPLSIADILVTDCGIDDYARQVLCEQVKELIVAPLHLHIPDD